MAAREIASRLSPTAALVVLFSVRAERISAVLNDASLIHRSSSCLRKSFVFSRFSALRLRTLVVAREARFQFFRQRYGFQHHVLRGMRNADVAHVEKFIDAIVDVT